MGLKSAEERHLVFFLTKQPFRPLVITTLKAKLQSILSPLFSSFTTFRCGGVFTRSCLFTVSYFRAESSLTTFCVLLGVGGWTTLPPGSGPPTTNTRRFRCCRRCRTTTAPMTSACRPPACRTNGGLFLIGLTALIWRRPTFQTCRTRTNGGF